MDVETILAEGEARETKSRRGWMLLGVGMGAALLLSACNDKKNKKDDEEDEEVDPPTP